MDLNKLRPTYSQWRAPLASAAEGRVRAASAPSASAAKQLAQPPKGKGGPMWQKFYEDAVARGHPLPEKLADTLLRSREHALELEAKRHKAQVTTHAPKPSETVAVAKGAVKKAGKPVLHDALRCKALTLEGRRCGFKSGRYGPLPQLYEELLALELHSDCSRGVRISLLGFFSSGHYEHRTIEP
jgi:hypothetical protein